MIVCLEFTLVILLCFNCYLLFFCWLLWLLVALVLSLLFGWYCVLTFTTDCSFSLLFGAIAGCCFVILRIRLVYYLNCWVCYLLDG